MRIVSVLFAVTLATAPVLAQEQQPAADKVTLANGDVLTGTIKSMADGKLVVTSPVLGDVEVPMGQVTDISTAEPVQLLTSTGDLINRRLKGIEGGRLLFDEGSASLSDLDKINPPKEKPPKWTGALKVGAGLSAGNTERRDVAASFEAELRRPEDRVSIDANWNYAEDKPTGGVWNLTERRTGAGLKYDWFLSEKSYVLANTRVLGDTFADLDLRYTVGLGFGRQIIDSDQTSFNAEAGLSYFYENYRSATPTKDYIAARLAYKLRHELSDSTKLLHSIEAYPSLEEADDVYFQMNTELQTSLTGSMIGSLAWIWDYDNTPSPGLDRSDHRVLLTIGWAF